MGPCHGKLATKDKNGDRAPRRSTPQPQASPPPLGQTSSLQPSVPRAQRRENPFALSEAASSPRSSTLSIRTTSSTSLPTVSSFPTVTFSSPGRVSGCSPRSAASTSQRQVQQEAGTSASQGAGHDPSRHVRGCRCRSCQPRLYEPGTGLRVKEEALVRVFLHPCVDGCRCNRCFNVLFMRDLGAREDRLVEQIHSGQV